MFIKIFTKEDLSSLQFILLLIDFSAGSRRALPRDPKEGIMCIKY